MNTTMRLRVVSRGDGWAVEGADDGDGLRLVNDFLGYLGDRHYAPGTRRVYAFDLLAWCRWLAGEHLGLEAVDTAMVLRFLTSCQGLAPATVNRRLAALGGLFAFRSMRDPSAGNPMPCGSAARRAPVEARGGLLGHLARPQPHTGPGDAAKESRAEDALLADALEVVEPDTAHPEAATRVAIATVVTAVSLRMVMVHFPVIVGSSWDGSCPLGARVRRPARPGHPP